MTTPEHMCPECRAGKCLGRPENCTESALDANDKWVLCECRHGRGQGMNATTTDQMGDLLDAVDELTKPTVTRVVQWVTDEHGKDHAQTTRVTHEPLLYQLEAAIASTLGAGAGRAMVERWALNVLDSDALHQFTVIDSVIRDWCRMLSVTPDRHPAVNLRAWYAAALGRRWEPASIGFYAATLRGWARMIRGKLNPPRSMQITTACPLCESDTWTDVDGTVYRHPVRVDYWDGDPDILARA